MAISEKAKQYHERMFPGLVSSYLRTDASFIESFDNFAFDEVVNEEGQTLDDKTRFIAILAVLIGCQGIDEFRAMAGAALNFNVTPAEIKEIVYQAVAYCGIGRVLPFLKAANDVLEAKGITLPLEEQSTTSPETRLEKGMLAQVDIFGEDMREFYKGGYMNRWLTSNCFGDYYTRKGLDLRQREMITFCFLAGQGGCEPQLTAHAKANMNVGNDAQFLNRVVSQLVPYIGYPRCLNAIRCINEAAK